jgi:hypothetical protein
MARVARASGHGEGFGLDGRRAGERIEGGKDGAERRVRNGQGFPAGRCAEAESFCGQLPSCAPSAIWHQQGAPFSLKETSSVICSMISARGREPLMSSRMRLRRRSI